VRVAMLLTLELLVNHPPSSIIMLLLPSMAILQVSPIPMMLVHGGE
jgi:hypothetical protein